MKAVYSYNNYLKHKQSKKWITGMVLNSTLSLYQFKFLSRVMKEQKEHSDQIIITDIEFNPNNSKSVISYKIKLETT